MNDTMNDMTASEDMNNGAINAGATDGASSDGDLDFQGEQELANGTDDKKSCGCGCKKDELANDFPKSQEPSGDGSGVKAGGEQAE